MLLRRGFILKPIEGPYVPLKSCPGIFKVALRFRDRHVLCVNHWGFRTSSIRHTIKPGTPEHRTTEHGTPAEHQNTGGTSEHWWNNRILAEQSEYHGTVEHVKSSGTT